MDGMNSDTIAAVVLNNTSGKKLNVLKFVVDTHTHTISSGHAYSTVQEMAKGAYEKGIEMIAITDHGPAMEGAPCIYHFGNLEAIPDTVYGTKIIRGVEANIIDYNGNTDMPDRYLRKLEFVMASFHDICIEPSTVEDHTRAMVNVLKNPLIDAVAHPGNPVFTVDIDQVVKTAKKYNKLIEINNHSFVMRKGSEENCSIFAEKCKEYGVRIICGSDSHISFTVGSFHNVEEILEGCSFPEELILNTSTEKMEAYLKERKERISRV